jgi:hypothetical protein
VQAPVDGWLDVKDGITIDRHLSRALVRIGPHATPLRVDFAVATRPHPAAWSVPEEFWTGHGTRHAGETQNTLTTHATVKQHLFAKLFEGKEYPFNPAVPHARKKGVQEAEQALGDPVSPLEWAGVVLDHPSESHGHERVPVWGKRTRCTWGPSSSPRLVESFRLLWLGIARISYFRVA